MRRVVERAIGGDDSHSPKLVDVRGLFLDCQMNNKIINNK